MSARRSNLLLTSVRSAPRTFAAAATLPGAMMLGVLFLQRDDAARWTPPLLIALVLVCLTSAGVLVGRRCRRPAEWFAAGPLLALPLLASNLAIAYAGCATADQGATGGLGWEKPKPDAAGKAEHRRVATLIPPRAPAAPAALPDLAESYNAPLWESHYTRHGTRDLTALPAGLSTFQGIPFDVRGLVRVSSRPGHDGNSRRFPNRVRGIPLTSRCRKLHFLLGTDWTPTNTAPFGRLTVHYLHGRPEDIPLVHGREALASWDVTAPAPGSGPGSGSASTPTLAWQDAVALDPGTGAPPTVRARLFLVSWSNPHAEMPLASLDITAEAADLSVFFLVALTPEPWEPGSP